MSSKDFTLLSWVSHCAARLQNVGTTNSVGSNKNPTDTIYLSETIVESSIEMVIRRTNASLPESLQGTMWTLQSSREEFHSWIMQVIVTQVQLSEFRGLRAENWGQSFTAVLWQITATQPEKFWEKIKISKHIFPHLAQLRHVVFCAHTGICWRPWPLVAASVDPPLKQSIF